MVLCSLQDEFAKRLVEIVGVEVLKQLDDAYDLKLTQYSAPDCTPLSDDCCSPTAPKGAV